MIARNVTLTSIVILVIGLIIGGVIVRAAFPREKEVVEEVTIEVPMTLPALTLAIQEGQIDVGNEYELGLDQRYHKIHTGVLGLECASCHISQPDTAQDVFTAQDVSPQAPGPVDKRACLGCHRSGAATSLYGTSFP